MERMKKSALSDSSIHTLWDELADLDVTALDASRNYLLKGICGMIDAHNAVWVGAVRMGSEAKDDPVNGWRPHTIHWLHSSNELMGASEEQMQMLEQGIVDVSTIRNVALSGSFRAHLMSELVPSSWFESAYYKAFYIDRGYHDTIWIGIPVNQDAEIYCGFYRQVGTPSFTEEERDTAACALRGLRWFHRQQMLGHGLLLASTPLTVSERNVLAGLMRGWTEKQIATAQGKSFHTTHEHVTRIFRKFGVNSRAALQALWFGKSS